MKRRNINKIIKGKNIGVIPGVKGSRAFPTMDFKDSDPFLMLDHIGPDPVGKAFVLDGKGHDHPHRGFETLTIMFEGAMNHKDSQGNRERLDSGSIQRMNAGKGIIHGGSMFSDQETGRFHEMQLWVNLPAVQKMSEPEVQNLSKEQVPFYMDGPNKVRVLAGEFNKVKSPMKTKASVDVAHVYGKPSSLSFDAFSSHHKLMVYVLEGSIEVNNTKLNEFELLDLKNEEGGLEINISENAEFLILSGKPLNEPVEFGGPFVMNTKAEIAQAYTDYENGKFGSIDNKDLLQW